MGCFPFGFPLNHPRRGPSNKCTHCEDDKVDVVCNWGPLNMGVFCLRVFLLGLVEKGNQNGKLEIHFGGPLFDTYQKSKVVDFF